MTIPQDSGWPSPHELTGIDRAAPIVPTAETLFRRTSKSLLDSEAEITDDWTPECLQWHSNSHSPFNLEPDMPKWCAATVVDKKIWTDGLFTIRISTEDVSPFLPGQFLQLGVFHEDHPQDESKLINRPYSVASPHGKELEFFIVLVEEGELTPRLWKLEVGSSLQVGQRAAGSFTLKKTPEAETLWLVATGTGLAPYIAMLRTQEPWEAFQKIVVVHGVRHLADLAYTDELKAFEESYPGRFKLVQALTREEAAGTLNGRIPSLFENGAIEDATGFTCRHDNSSVLLCGNPAMLDTMEEVLGQRDMKRHRSKSPGQIVLERYW